MLCVGLGIELHLNIYHVVFFAGTEELVSELVKVFTRLNDAD